ncbi:MAG: DmsC/YnfH family molybdoenzyme membrane anchor subunit [Anaerolineales bacterium]|jgi:anaerobic dimethyl sulfoxide reductase subunit C (anchor subunit)|nr:DmsC/YnfH family molybdoenzyme membrane anchor subunit [Anaerolineales bacterium]
MNVREWALPVYTILMQLSVGVFMLLWIIRARHLASLGYPALRQIAKIPLAIISITIVMAIVGSHFHLSQPFRSFLAVLNFRSSWLSREIVFTLLFSLTITWLLWLHWFTAGHDKLISGLGWLAIGFGLIMVFCMAQIYLLPTQTAWNSPITVFSFYASVFTLGFIALPTILLMDLSFSTVLEGQQFGQRSLLVRKILVGATYASILAWLGILALNFYQISFLRAGDAWAQASFELLTSLYLPLLVLRLGLPLAGIIWLASSVFRAIQSDQDLKELMVPVYSACIVILVSEILGRFLFYATHVRIGV